MPENHIHQGPNMAILVDTSTGVAHALRPYHVFGRSAQHADSPLVDAKASMLHATARWGAPQWTLTDQSRNGCYINGELLGKDQAAVMYVGDEIRFGSPDSAAWRVMDLAAPADLLLPMVPGKDAITLQAFQVLPHEDAPQACIYRLAGGQWQQETADGALPLHDGDLVYLNEEPWRFVCTVEPRSTLVPGGVTCMKFHSSLDEEHVTLSLSRGSLKLDLGERSHHYLLMVLARQRLNDVQRGFDFHSQGWLDFDQLVSMLGQDKAHLNIQIFRLRKQFEPAVSQDLITHDFIERRRGGVRLGNVAVEVTRGSVLEGSWRPPVRSRRMGISDNRE